MQEKQALNRKINSEQRNNNFDKVLEGRQLESLTCKASSINNNIQLNK